MFLNRRGSSLFAKNLLGFFEKKSISVRNNSSTVDLTISLEKVSYVSSPDAKRVLRSVCKSNINKLVFEQLNINLLTTNLTCRKSEMIKGVCWCVCGIWNKDEWQFSWRAAFYRRLPYTFQVWSKWEWWCYFTICPRGHTS